MPADAERLRHHDRLLEGLLPGADLALDACAIVDLSVEEAGRRALELGRRPACGPGCDVCCHQPIPATPLESLLLAHHARLRFDAALRGRLARRLPDEGHPLKRCCPMLLDGCCQAYPVRPLACRRYLVLDAPCAPGEDAASSRPGDMLAPDGGALVAALERTLPWYAAHPAWAPLLKARGAADARAFFRDVTSPVQLLPWERILIG